MLCTYLSNRAGTGTTHSCLSAQYSELYAIWYDNYIPKTHWTSSLWLEMRLFCWQNPGILASRLQQIHSNPSQSIAIHHEFHRFKTSRKDESFYPGTIQIDQKCLASLPRSVLVPEGNLRILKFHVGPIEINSQTFYPTGLTTTGRVSFSVLRIVIYKPMAQHV